MADDIADDQGDPGAGQRNDVEPVTAHFRAGPAGQVAGRHLDRLLVRQPLRQQAALQGQRGRALARVPAGVVDGDGRLGGQLLGEDQVVGGEGLRPFQAGEGDHAEQRAAGPERHGDPAGQPFGGEGPVDQRVAGRPVGRVGGEARAEGPLAALAGSGGELDRGPAGGHAAGGDGTGSVADEWGGPWGRVGVLLRAVLGGTAERDRLAGGERGRGGRFLSAQHLVEEIHADEVGETRHRSAGQFVRGTDHVECPADAAARLVEDEQALPGPVLGAHVESPVGDRADPALAVPYGPDAGGPGVGVVAAAGTEDGDETRGLARPRHLGELVGVGLVVPLGEQRAVEFGEHLAVLPAEHLFLGVRYHPARAGVDPLEPQLRVVDAQREGALLEGPVGDHGAASPALHGHHVTQCPPVGARQRVSRHHGVHRGTVPVAQRDEPRGVGAGAVPLGEAGWRGIDQQLGHRAADGVLGRPAQQQPAALTPAAHHAVRAHHDDGSGGVLLAGHLHAPRLRPDGRAPRGRIPAVASSVDRPPLPGAPAGAWPEEPPSLSSRRSSCRRPPGGTARPRSRLRRRSCRRTRPAP